VSDTGFSNEPKVLALADRLANLKEAYKADCDAVMEDAEAAEVDKPGLRRLVSWRGKDAAKRAEQEAIDDQYRFLAGDRPTPATLPPDCELARAIALYAANQTVRQVAETLDVSVGKAQKLRTLAKAFDVHFPVNVNAVNAVEMTADDLGDYLMLVSIEEDRIQAMEIAYEDARGSREMVADDLGDPLWVVDKDRARFRDRVRAIAAKVKTLPELDAALDTLLPEDDLIIPDFLRRVRT
jgi:uncharacterized protein (UPF0335 family)